MQIHRFKSNQRKRECNIDMTDMMWPESMYSLLEKYYRLQVKNGKLELSQRKLLVALLKNIYNTLPLEKRTDLLIPADGSYLKERAIIKEPIHCGITFGFDYRWPAQPFVGCYRVSSLAVGEKYDRIGNENGSFVAPIRSDGTPEPLLSRGLPYYIPEKDIQNSPAYHSYSIKEEFKGSANKPVKRGVVAQAFQNNPPDGGGSQVELPGKIKDLKEWLKCE